MEAHGSTVGLRWELRGLNHGEGARIPGVGVKSVEIRKNTSGEGELLPMIDAEVRKCGDQTGLDTLVVHTVNDVH